MMPQLARLYPPQSAYTEERIRKRSWRVRSANDLLAVVEDLKREKAVGSLCVNFGPGGAMQSATFEERSKAS
jgi:hypothetical protein